MPLGMPQAFAVQCTLQSSCPQAGQLQGKVIFATQKLSFREQTCGWPALGNTPGDGGPTLTFPETVGPAPGDAGPTVTLLDAEPLPGVGTVMLAETVSGGGGGAPS